MLKNKFDNSKKAIENILEVEEKKLIFSNI